MLKNYLIIFALILPICGFSVDYKPWFGVDFILDTKVSEEYQYYHTINASCRDFTYSSNDNFVDGSASMAILGNWSIEAEALLAFTRRQGKALDCLRATGRYLLANDIAGDRVSLAAGITLTRAFKHSLHDPSSFHHGIYEGEMHLSMGKEFPLCPLSPTWDKRVWGLIAFGLAERGNPWGRLQLQYEKNYCDTASLYAFTHFLFGFGDKNIHSVHHFKGYGPIRHRSVDLGVGGIKRFESDWIVALQVLYRAYAHNFPKNAFCAKLSFEYPLSLTSRCWR